MSLLNYITGNLKTQGAKCQGPDCAFCRFCFSFPAKDKDGQNLLQKFVTEHQRNQYFQTVQIQQAASFVIVHYAGQVKYSIKVRTKQCTCAEVLIL